VKISEAECPRPGARFVVVFILVVVPDFYCEERNFPINDLKLFVAFLFP
jgi:hypothetical protein